MSRLKLIGRLALVTITIFIIQKPLFIIYNYSSHQDVDIKDFFDVIFHALSLDLTVTSYILILPWLFITISFFFGNNQVLRGIFRVVLPAYFVIIVILTTIVFVSDTALYKFWKFKIDATIFNYIDKPTEVMASVSVWYVLMYSVIVIVLSVIISWIYIRTLRSIKLEKASNILLSFWMLPIAALLFLALRGGIGAGTACVANVYYSNNKFLNHAAVNPNFSLIYSYSHSKNFSSEFRYMNDAECKRIVKEIYPEKKAEEILTDTLLNNKRPNILMIVWEGCGEQVAKCLGGKGITPGLSKIAEEGVLFSRCYSNSFRTDQGLVCLLTGWLGLPSASLMKIPEKSQKLPGLAMSLKKANYSTEFWYGGDISFTNMGGFVHDNGFDKIISDKDFGYKDKYYSKWGVADGVLFEKLTDNLINEKAKQAKPWFSTVLTLSSHEPWEVPFTKYESKQENAFAYTDTVVYKFIEKLKKTEIWSNTLVIIIADHGYIVDESSPKKEEELIHIPLVMTGGALGVKGIRIDKIMNQSDLSATLLAQLGLPSAEYLFSRNILGKDYNYPTAINYSSQTTSFIDSTGVSVNDFVGGTIIYESEPASSHSRILKSKAILQDLYNKTDQL